MASFHFQGVADGVAQGLVHVGDEGGCFAAGVLADIDHDLSQFFGAVTVHNGALPYFSHPG
ncbi:MAG: hypothetical protein M5U34_12795 [Chloroflexi bacterium]|nr:hypothetical protein [Chloroflexota bacterium]